MKTENELKAEMKSVIEEIGEKKDWETKDGEKTVKRLRKRLSYLKIILMYMQTNPSKDFCEKERDRLCNRINKSMGTYKPLDANRFTKSECTKHKKEFETLMGVPKVRKQLTTLNFILK